MKKRNFIISWELYPFDVMVSIGEKQEDVVERVNKTTYKLNEEEKEALWMTGKGKTVMLEGGQTIIEPKCNILSHTFSSRLPAVYFLYVTTFPYHLQDQ